MDDEDIVFAAGREDIEFTRTTPVTACFGSLLDELDAFIVGHDGHRNISSDRVRDLYYRPPFEPLCGILPRKPSEAGMSERHAICHAVVGTPDRRVGRWTIPITLGLLPRVAAERLDGKTGTRITRRMKLGRMGGR